ncbi:ABC transporter permease [Alkalinema pantanalense CENA528]|uniref:ABC transporter permease n=1 Tax=Alkalinema pantanalense TaxID=1620705 RepID=UPI003D6FA0E9
MDTPTQLIFALGLIVLTLILVAWQRLDLLGSVVVAAGRSILQMIVFSYILATIFIVRDPVLTLIAVLALLLVAAIVTQKQLSQRIPYLLPITLGSLFLGSSVTLGYVFTLVVQSTPWYEPRVLLPLAGLVFAHAMNGAVIAGEQFIHSLSNNTQEIETHLSLGATPAIAIAPYRQAAIRAGLLPTLNAMTIAGLGILPSFMGGSLLAGFDPLQAGAYQLLLLFMTLLATLITLILLLTGITQQFFTPAAQLRRW